MKPIAFRNWSLRDKVIVPVTVVGLALTACVYLLVSATQRQLLLAQAERSASYVGTQIGADRQYYTERVIGRIADNGVALRPGSLAEVEHGRDTIPLPATFVHGTSAIVNAKGQHTADLLSLWNINPDKAPRTTQEKQALEALARDKSASVSWIANEGLSSARFYRATADIATSPSCVACHNGHPQSPKRDFRLYETMGALVVSLPLANDLAAAQANTWLWTGVIGGVFALLIVAIIVIQMQHVTRPIEALEMMADRISRGDVDTPVPVHSSDEIGRLAMAFDRMRKSVQILMGRLGKK